MQIEIGKELAVVAIAGTVLSFLMYHMAKTNVETWIKHHRFDGKLVELEAFAARVGARLIAQRWFWPTTRMVGGAMLTAAFIWTLSLMKVM
jgi:hypothetical protein